MGRSVKNAKATLLSAIVIIASIPISAGTARAHEDADGDGIVEAIDCGNMAGSGCEWLEPSGDPGLLRDNTWTNMHPDPHANGRYYFAMVADGIEHKVVLFGGLGYVDSISDYTSLDDTWIYDRSTNSWKMANPPIAPPPRYGHNMAYSEGDSVIVLYGGVDPYQVPHVAYDDIWLYRTNEDRWVEVDLTTPIPARGFHSMACDGGHDRIVVFGGYNWLTTQWFNDTWTYTVGDDFCVRQYPGTSPSVRDCHRMVHDESNGVIVMFGGWFPAQELNDTWIYGLAENNWTRMYPATSPARRMSFGMAYNHVTAGAVIFGGGRLPPLFSDTWTYDLGNNEWIDLYPAASPSARHRMPLSSLDGVVVLFGGYSSGGQLDDTWIYEPPMSSVEEPHNGGSVTTTLFQNAQNPVSGGATIGYYLPVAAQVSLKIYNASGRLVRTLVYGFEGAGYNELIWDGRDSAGRQVMGGTYYNRIQTEGCVETQRIVIVR